MSPLDCLARSLHACEAVDTAQYRRQLRVLQSLWRQQHGYPIGEHRGRSGDRPLGSRLAMPWAGQTLANFIDERIRRVVREEVLNPARCAGKLYGQPRIFNDLLSSQPLAFNMFAIPSRALRLATALIRRLTGDDSIDVTAIDFEWSPGRRDSRYTGDRSAFDVFIRYRDAQGQRCFLGVEVKYHEDLKVKAASISDRHRTIARECGWFRPESIEALGQSPLEQLWRDHLLAASLVLAGDFDQGQFVVVYPQINIDCRSAVTAYAAQLSDTMTFAAWTLEDIVAQLRAVTTDPWVDAFDDRYLALSRLDRAAVDHASPLH